MAKFRDVPFWTPMIPVLLMAWILKKIGKAKSFLKFMGWMNRKPFVQRTIFKKYSPTQYDTFAAVFAKSGTNMVMQTMLQIAWRGEAKFEHIHDLVPWPEFGVQSCVAPLHLKGKKIESPTGLRVIKAHAQSQYLPFHKDAKYVTVIRDPKEVCVSGFYFLPPIMGLSEYISIEDWYDCYLSENSPLGSWAEHTASFWAMREQPNVLVLTFNEMKNDIKGCTKRIADLMQVKLTEQQLARVLEQNKFSYMKEHESMFCPPLFPFTDKKKSPKMVRSGKSGNSGELLNKEQQAAIDKFMLAELQRLESDFPYREWFEVVE